MRHVKLALDLMSRLLRMVQFRGHGKLSVINYYILLYYVLCVSVVD